MSEDALVIVPIPPLVTVLAFHEAQKGGPLTEEEVLEIRGKAPSMTMRQSAAAAMAAARGYDDIDPERAWEEWSVARVGLGFEVRDGWDFSALSPKSPAPGQKEGGAPPSP